ncbi:MAG TPA: excalibur calcium-binding domain-containing protein [Rubellimicrobium sp.]|nr:excalibur calcium-binding domain-containing protein [Rubellimicrobium sp.]
MRGLLVLGLGAALTLGPAAVVRADGGYTFRNCSEARAAGYSNIRRGTYGYGPHLDRDNDGIGCES